MSAVSLAPRFALALAALAAFGAWGLHAAGLLRLLHHQTVPSREG